jgi:hypothetical protein
LFFKITFLLTSQVKLIVISDCSFLTLIFSLALAFTLALSLTFEISFSVTFPVEVCTSSFFSFLLLSRVKKFLTESRIPHSESSSFIFLFSSELSFFTISNLLDVFSNIIDQVLILPELTKTSFFILS